MFRRVALASQLRMPWFIDLHSAKVLKEFVEGVKVYFDRALGNMLLYRFERPQYETLKEENSQFMPSEHYGLEHLLRLLGNVRSPAFVVANPLASHPTHHSVRLPL